MEGGPPTFRQDFTCPALLKDSTIRIPIRGSHPLWPAFPEPFRFLVLSHWPGPRSLATTNGVSVDVLSSGYLDVSIRRVRLARLCIHRAIPQMRWVSPFGNLRIKACSRLPEAYRSVLRPSSPLGAKASTKRPSHACFAKPPYAESSPRADSAGETAKTRIIPRNSEHPSPREGDARRQQDLFTMFKIGGGQGAARLVSGASAGGGGERIRTDDLLLAKQALSRLSYTPNRRGGPG